MQQTEREGAIQVELYVRSELPPPAEERVAAVERRLEELDSTGVIEGLDRTEWDKRVPVDDCDGAVRDTYLAFRAWADDAGVSLQPFFGTRECYTAEHGEYTDWLVFPAMCLATYEDGDLVSVYPHADGGTTRDVEDGIDALDVDASVEPGRATLAAD